MKEDFSVDDIRSLSACDQVRLRPELYFQKCFASDNLNTLVFEWMQHAFANAEKLAGTSIEVSLSAHSCRLIYRLGMPLHKEPYGVPFAQLLLTELFAGSAHTSARRDFEFLDNVDFPALVFVSSTAQVVTQTNGLKAQFQFAKGVLQDTVITSEAGEDFTEIVFEPDTEVFGQRQFIPQEVARIVKLFSTMEGVTPTSFQFR